MATPFLNVLAPDFNAFSPELIAARDAGWYARTPIGYAVLRQPDIAALLRQPNLRQGFADLLAMRGMTSGPLVDWWRMVVLNVEGEQHTRLRRLVSKAFTPPSVDRLRPYMRATAERLIDAFRPNGECDFMPAFADPYPLDVICELLGIPPEQRAQFNGWADDLGMIFSPDVVARRDKIEAALAGLYACVDALLDVHRNAPGPDLISALIAAEVDGDRLSRDELRAMVVGLVFAGNDTTRNQLGLGMVSFLRHPEQWERLGADPALAPRAVEEILRERPTISGLLRIVTEPFSYRDLDFTPGTAISLFTGPANADAAIFGDPDFDITVERPIEHLTFGGGIHRCLGSWLARAEMQEALPILARRLRGIRPAGDVVWRPPTGIAGPASLPLAFEVPIP